MFEILPKDVIKIIASHIRNPNSFLCSCKAISVVSKDCDALPMWLGRQHGRLALYYFSKSPCSKHLSVNKQLLTIRLLLGKHAQSFRGDWGLAVLRWAAIQIADGSILELILDHASKEDFGRAGDTLATLLVEASAMGRDEIVRILLYAGAPTKGCLTMKTAVEHGRVNVVRALLETGRVNPRADNDCALRTAAKLGQAACVELLLEAGCCPLARYGEALCLSVGGGHTEVVRLLLQRGADVSSRPSLLQMAVDADEDRQPLLALLLDAGAVDEGGAALSHAASAGKELFVQQLLTASAYPRGQTYDPDVLTMSLKQCIVNNHLSIARQLLDYGAPVDSSLLALRKSFPMNDCAVLGLLEQYSSNVRCSQEALDGALSIAAAEADSAYLGLLLRWGANPMALDCQALRKAVLHGRTACVKSIVCAAGIAGLKHEMPCCVMRAAVQRGHFEVVSELLAAGLWPSPSAHHCCLDRRSCTARMLCAAGSADMASLLMRFGAGAHAAEAIRLVACGKAPSWRNEEVVQVVMDAMMITMSRSLRCSESGVLEVDLLHSCCYEDMTLTKEEGLDVVKKVPEDSNSYPESLSNLLMNVGLEAAEKVV
ncbi:hypothetical protein CEUSTIGMA_g6272.t1 [Chlamydomonas eustigma]|uniref:Uncharacterized protein n=1 Tax=Chlamydomonas eustigma TaxID=1157962 RepID=A0A250X6Z4_9CHLO|nr:hypothetical protein CEUSTIGMA_g6272.t1 [Chlamydomonas eustigma]|eukprot:GAX78835.1 hypothetical protein CEUSTIGMA_g6272.t1 [Chlamydomonas eustigma]